MPRTLAHVATASVLSGRAAHGPMIPRDTADVTPATGASAAAPHSREVRVSGGDLPAAARYEALGTLDAGTIWCGGGDGVDRQMAERARGVGADAATDARHRRRPSGFAWAAPHGSGQAVEILNPAAAKLDAPGGRF